MMSQNCVPSTKGKLIFPSVKRVRLNQKGNHRVLLSLKLNDYKYFSHLCMVQVMQKGLIGAYKTIAAGEGGVGMQLEE